MSRALKFRVWDVEKRRFIRETPDNRVEAEISVDFSSGVLVRWNGFELEQWTGLVDNNGQDVYEGDILCFTYWYFDGDQAETQMIGEVVYISEEASYGLDHIRNQEWLRHIGAKPGTEDRQSFSGWEFSPDDMEVIGNVHENPELVEALP